MFNKYFFLVPPSSPALLDGWGAIIGSSFGPFKEGDTASLSCEVRGGKVENKEGDTASLSCEVRGGKVENKEGDTASLPCEVRGGKEVNKDQAMLLLVQRV